ncbi:MAG: hypothetical protein GTO18_14675 [Anaerolineales bacterium]|nr:hypothetical protein [Anaerolineales bacterium]
MVVEKALYLFWGMGHRKKEPKAVRPPIRKYIEIKDGRLIPIDPDGMVDVAVRELGARVVDVDEEDAG